MFCLLCVCNYKEYMKYIYSRKRTIEETTKSETEGTYLGLFFVMEDNYKLSTKLCDEFGFYIVNCPLLLKNIPSGPSYDANISQCTRHAYCCSYHDPECPHKMLVERLLSQDYDLKRHTNTLMKFCGRWCKFHHEI